MQTKAKGRPGVVCRLKCVIHVRAPWGRDTCHLGRYINPRTFTFVPFWTTDNRWRTTAWSGRALMALFAHAAKLSSMGLWREAEQVKYRGTRPLQFPPAIPSLALIQGEAKYNIPMQKLRYLYNARIFFYTKFSTFIHHICLHKLVRHLTSFLSSCCFRLTQWRRNVSQWDGSGLPTFKSGTARNAFCRPTFWPQTAYCTYDFGPDLPSLFKMNEIW